MPELGMRVRERRRELGMTIDRLSDEAGLAVTSVRAIERGASPNVANLAAIARALRTSVGALLGESASDTQALERELPGWFALTTQERAAVRVLVAPRQKGGARETTARTRR